MALSAALRVEADTTGTRSWGNLSVAPTHLFSITIQRDNGTFSILSAARNLPA